MRNEQMKTQFLRHFGLEAQWIFSAPGRTELSGNHTDHQRGCVLAAAVNLDSRAAVSKNGDNCIRVLSEGYPLCTVSLPVGEPAEAEYGTTLSLIRGVAAAMQPLAKELCGFDCYVTSTVLPGSGLSSSAAFEVLMGVIMNTLWDCGCSAPKIAQIGQYAENVYFGKPCGLMDQMASSVGSAVAIDFADPDSPTLTPLALDLEALGYDLCIIDSGADHAGLTDLYAAIPGELKAVCKYFGVDVLRQLPEERFYSELPRLRSLVGDRAILRSVHCYEENKRVQKQTEALQRGDFDEFLRLVTASGSSSWRLLQNVIPEGHTRMQELAFALTLAEKLLDGQGAVRVHGGGFAGTIQAFVPHSLLETFRSRMEAVLGEGSCHVLSIRKEGGILMEECK
ncbi:MAG: galactokinase [Oscillospiraceae bacterium]|nr:galactokinase [Oscillospiraceae bacterium]